MACTSATTHEFAEGATTCRCGKARTVERTVMEPPPLTPNQCFVCKLGHIAVEWAFDSVRGWRHATCNPARVCKCGALAPEGEVWSWSHRCCLADPASPSCALHTSPYCYEPDPLYKPKPRTFTVAEVIDDLIRLRQEVEGLKREREKAS